MSTLVKKALTVSEVILQNPTREILANFFRIFSAMLVTLLRYKKSRSADLNMASFYKIQYCGYIGYPNGQKAGFLMSGTIQELDLRDRLNFFKNYPFVNDFITFLTVTSKSTGMP
jgi:hypothetical protein